MNCNDKISRGYEDKFLQRNRNGKPIYEKNG